MPKKLLFFLIFFVNCGCYQTNNNANLEEKPLTNEGEFKPKDDVFLPDHTFN